MGFPSLEIILKKNRKVLLFDFIKFQLIIKYNLLILENVVETKMHHFSLLLSFKS